MMRLLVAALLALAPAVAAAAAPVAPVLATADARDVHSFARPHEARVVHVALDLTVDFAARRICGTARLDIVRRPDAKAIVLDSKGLEIAAVSEPSGRPLPWSVGAADKHLGAPVTIALRPATTQLVIRYRSAPDASALQWLTPAQTAGKRHPYLFSQGQPIENRSWLPTQDSPGIRQSWEATVRVPAPLKAVMSAPPASPGRCTERGECRFSYRMENPVAPYLIAIAVGDLAFRRLGPRSGVWSEPTVVDSAAREFADTEMMIAAAERLFGPYRWGRFDMIVLPPSFPFGGMENPTLTFLTPTLIAGDKSLVSVVAHELAHAWSGNLATNASWADFWLNEGMTTYAERRIIADLYGPRRAAQQVALGIDALTKQVAELGPTSPDTRLRLDLAGRPPDAGLTDIAYEKGAAFLRVIEQAVGRPRFDSFLKGWFERHAFAPVTSAMFLAELRQRLVAGDAALERRLQLDSWVHGRGIPANAVAADPAAFAAVDSAVAAFAGGAATDPAAWRGWTTDERLRFLAKLPRRLAADRLTALDRAFALSAAGNSEVRFAWLELAVANRYRPAAPSLAQFLTAQGRRKFVRPLFKALAADPDWGRPLAASIYPRARPLYHPIVTRELDQLGLNR